VTSRRRASAGPPAPPAPELLDSRQRKKLAVTMEESGLVEPLHQRVLRDPEVGRGAVHTG
jgi:hypothetical protein